MDQFQQQVQQHAREKLAYQLPEWLKECSHKDMNSVFALTEFISRVFIRGVLTGVEIALKIHRGEL